MRTQPLRDFSIYLKAAVRYREGEPVYLAAPFAQVPPDLSDLPFVYPPPTLIPFAALAALPWPIAGTLWWVALGACLIFGFRALGVSRRWSFLMLLWPPAFHGLWAGNVAAIGFLLFALGPRWGAGLVLAGLFKPQHALPALWLVREKRSRELVVGCGLLGALAIASLPFIGLDRWLEWWHGLGRYQESERTIPDLAGMALWRYLPLPLVAGLAAVLLALSLRAGGVTGLKRLGATTAVVSPSLFATGFLFALPSLLDLRPALFWLAIILTCVPPQGPLWWLALGLAVAGWTYRPLQRAGERLESRSDPVDASPRSGSRPWTTFRTVAARNTNGSLSP
ncbi:MAG TPA: glycosyltransferase family 87 protein [Candidatus Limnocylindrales bacterium]|nr:glycosyltransferase family 87 protein [Candidatus Limnocylindrales bacterium]